MTISKSVGTLVWYALFAAMLVFTLGPIVWMLSTSFKPEAQIATTNINWIPRTFTLDNYQHVFDHFEILRWTLNSLVVASVATLLVLLLDSLAGYALARMEFMGRGLIFGLVLSMLFVPMQITVVPLFLLFSEFNLTDHYLALIFPVGANVTGVFLMRQFFLGIPYELEDAARVDGASTLRIWWSVVLPLARPALTAVAIITFLSAWNSFFWPLMSLRPGQSMSAQAYGPSMAGAVIAALPPILVFYALQRYFIQGISMTGLKG
jgi:ABC-type glycerol-3-phosphate transport system permease component